MAGGELRVSNCVIRPEFNRKAGSWKDARVRYNSLVLVKAMAARFFILFLAFLFVLPLLMVTFGTVSLGIDWRTANRDSAGIAPEAEKTPEAVVQVYAARALNWRGIFGVHTWIATKEENAPHYIVHQMIGWRVLRNLPGVFSEPGIPDRTGLAISPSSSPSCVGPGLHKQSRRSWRLSRATLTRMNINSGPVPTATPLPPTLRGGCLS